MMRESKKVLMILSAIVVLLIVTAFSLTKEDQSLKRISVHGDMVHYDDLMDLEDMADLVVIGEPTENFMNRDHIIKTGEDNSIEDFYSNTEIKIHKVLVNNDQSDVNEGEFLSIIEPSSVIDDQGETFEFVMDDYTSMSKKADYVFFLKKNTFGEYSVIGNQLGKYNIDGNDPRDLAINSDSLTESEDISVLEETFDLNELNQEFEKLLIETEDSMHSEADQEEELENHAEEKLSFYKEVVEQYDKAIDDHIN